MDIKMLGRAGLTGLLCVVTGSLAAAMHYEANAPQFAVVVGMLLPPIVISLLAWKRISTRLMAGLALTGVSYLSLMWTAVFVFRDGL